MHRHLPCLAAALALLASDFALAQSSVRRIGASPNTTARPASNPQGSGIQQGPATSATGGTQTAQPGAPSPNGLASPFPPQLPSLFVPGTSAAGTAPPENVTEAPNTAVMGAGPSGPLGPTRVSAGANYTIVDIARAFIMADTDRDGELTRSEAARLTIMPLNFEEMDANHDNRLTRSEYEDSVR